MTWLPLDKKIYEAMNDIISESGFIPVMAPKTAADELILLTVLLNAIAHFTKIGWDNDTASDHSLKKGYNKKLVNAWWRLLNNVWEAEPTSETLDTSDSEAYDWDRLNAIIVRFYLNRAVKEITDA
jgi:hypothetical protein